VWGYKPAGDMPEEPDGASSVCICRSCVHLGPPVSSQDARSPCHTLDRSLLDPIRINCPHHLGQSSSCLSSHRPDSCPGVYDIFPAPRSRETGASSLFLYPPQLLFLLGSVRNRDYGVRPGRKEPGAIPESATSLTPDPLSKRTRTLETDQGSDWPGSWTMVSQACYSSSDGRRSYSRPYPLYFPSPTERRFPLSSHDSRAITMAEQLDSDSTPQRKRIAVAVRPIPPKPLFPFETP
jgi:hypothetical protein